MFVLDLSKLVGLFSFFFLTLVFLFVGGINTLVGLELLFCTLTKNKSLLSNKSYSICFISGMFELGEGVNPSGSSFIFL